MEYSLLDSGQGQRLEQFGEYTLVRPCPQAVWTPGLPATAWKAADALFEREEGNRWIERRPLPSEWHIQIEGIKLKLKRTEFGHVGVFPEHASQWQWMQALLRQRPGAQVLNLFAYSGGVTLAAAQAGAEVCHLDAARGMVEWARENAALNQLEKAPIRWIIDDVRKFITRELKRGMRYDAIILDPPTFGRGKFGEVFKIEKDLLPILKQCKALLSEHPLFILFSCHTSGYTPIVVQQFLRQFFEEGTIESGEMVLKPAKGNVVPCGTFGRWTHD